MRHAAILATVVLGLSACSSVITSKDTPLGLPPAASAVVGVGKADITAANAEAVGRYSFFKDDLFATLVSSSEAGGFVVRQAGQPLTLSASMSYKSTTAAPNIVIGVLSLFIPPLAFVPEDYSERFTVRFAVRDRSGAVVYQNAFDESVQGYIKGWYIARVNAWIALKEKLAAAAARSAARLILQDVAAHGEELSSRAAGPAATPPERAAPAAPAPAGQTDEWWRK